MQRFTVVGLSALLVSALMAPIAQAETSTTPQVQSVQSSQSSETRPTTHPVRIEATKSTNSDQKELMPSRFGVRSRVSAIQTPKGHSTTGINK
jgi:cytoskeletal protein RodZ